MIELNLITPSRSAGLELEPWWLTAFFVVLGEIGLIVAVIAFGAFRIAMLNSDQARLTQTVSQEKATMQQVSALRDEAQALSDKAAQLERIKGSPQQAAEILSETAADVPADVWMTGLVVTRAPMGGGQIVFQGTAGSFDDISRFMLVLDASPMFTDAELNLAQKSGSSAGVHKMFGFSVNGLLNPNMSQGSPQETVSQ